jgi:hypothetical protein
MRSRPAEAPGVVRIADISMQRHAVSHGDGSDHPNDYNNLTVTLCHETLSDWRGSEETSGSRCGAVTAN